MKVFDASALLAVVYSEPGADVVLGRLAEDDGCVSAVNWAEVASKMVERGLPADEVAGELRSFGLEVVPFDEAQALAAGALRAQTRALGLSLGDRCCLALARHRSAPVVTADRTWAQLAGFTVEPIR